MELFNKIVEVVEGAEKDAIKFYEGENKAAGVRLRKAMQEIKKLAQDVRLDVSKVNEDRK